MSDTFDFDPLRQIAEDESFDDRLKNNLALTPDEKRKRMAQVDARAKKPIRAQIASGERFDVLEFPTDLPVIPMAGSVFPSERFFRYHKEQPNNERAK